MKHGSTHINMIHNHDVGKTQLLMSDPESNPKDEGLGTT